MPDLDSVDKNHDDIVTDSSRPGRHLFNRPAIGNEMQMYHSSDLTQRRRVSSPKGCGCTEHCLPPAQELSQHVHTPCTHVYTMQHRVTLGHYNGTSPSYIYYCSLYILCIFLCQYICIHTCIQCSISGNTGSFSWHDRSPILMMDLTMTTALNIQFTVCILFSFRCLHFKLSVYFRTVQEESSVTSPSTSTKDK